MIATGAPGTNPVGSVVVFAGCLVEVGAGCLSNIVLPPVAPARRVARIESESEVTMNRTAETVVAFESKLADPRIYGPMLDVPGALEEIKKNTFCFLKTGDIVVGTGAYRLRADNSVYISNVAVNGTKLRHI